MTNVISTCERKIYKSTLQREKENYLTTYYEIQKMTTQRKIKNFFRTIK